MERLLREQRTVIENGVVVGDSAAVPDETRALTRQLPASSGWTGQLRPLGKLLSDVEPFLKVRVVLLAAVTASVPVENPTTG